MTSAAYTGSMADEMEKAFIEEWPSIMGAGSPVIDDQVRLLFIAVAKGVVRHLNKNPTAFKVNVSKIQNNSSIVDLISIDKENTPIS